MRIILITLLTFAACSKTQESPTDDYVLIEFASKLEEDQQKLVPDGKSQE